MSFLYRIYLLYLFYSGIFWGYVTFTFNATTNRFEASRKLIFWNRFMTIFFIPLVGLQLISLYHKLTYESIFELIYVLADLMIRLLIFSSTLYITCNINNNVFKLITLARELQRSINLPQNAYKFMSQIYTNVFLLDISVTFLVIHLTKDVLATYTSKMNFQLLISLPNLWLFIGVKLIISSYIFALNFSAELIKKINDDISGILRNIEITGKVSHKMKCKNSAVDLDHYAILYAEVVKFVQEIHSIASFNNMITLLCNLENIVKTVCKFINL